MNLILLAGEDWQVRALLRAQLLEEGCEVEAYDTVAQAVGTLQGRLDSPALLLADLSASSDPSRDADLLSEWSAKIPIWVIASRSLIVEKGFKGRGFEVIFFRPIDVGELVEQIKRRQAED